MMPDAEVLKVAVEILSELPIGPFTIKLNHRKLLDAMLDLCGVPASSFRGVCSAIDKLDKEPWEAVRDELVTDKGLAPEVAAKIGEMVTTLKGVPLELLATLKAHPLFPSHPAAASALADLTLLYGYLGAMGALDKITFDMSLARGLDYYTGLIYEAVPTGLPEGISVGSIAAGGRYDNLVGMFSAPGSITPCVGVSVGLERVFAVMEAKAAAANGGSLRRTPVSVLVASIPSSRYDMAQERMRVLNELWAAGLSAEMAFAADPKLQKQLTAALEAGIPYLVVLAEDELDRGEVGVKDLVGREQVTARRKDGGVVEALLKLGARPHFAPAVAAAAGAPAAAAAATATAAVVEGK
jgi:histidyl-tRNA synthetase